MVSILPRDEGKGCAPCLKVILTTLATVLWLVPGELVPMPVPQPAGLSACKEEEERED